MSTVADLKVGDTFSCDVTWQAGYLAISRRTPSGIHTFTATRIEENIAGTFRYARIYWNDEQSNQEDFRSFRLNHPVTIIEQEQDMPAITATAGDLLVGDVFTVSDRPETHPLWMHNYVQGTELTVTGVDSETYAHRRVIRFTGTPSDESKVFMDEHPVTIVRRANHLSASALEAPTTPPAATEIPDGLYPALPYGTPVTFTPEAGVGRGLNTGTVGVATWEDSRWNYEIRTDDGRNITRRDRGGGETVVPTPESAPVVEATEETRRQVIPRTSDAAKAMLTIGEAFLGADTIEALKRLALYLPGGRAEAGGNELAARKDLCIQYEAIVCPQLGWAGREQMRGSLYSTQVPQNWLDEVERFERANAGADAPSMIRGFARRYARGGSVNEAIVEHMGNHLEEHKYEATNQVLDALGLDGIEVNQEKEYRVTVRLERTRTVTEYQYVSTVVTARDADEAHEDVSSNINMDQYADDDDWTEDDYSVDHSSVDENWDDSSTEEV